MKTFLTNKKQRVVSNGKSSLWSNVKVGVPKGYIHGQFSFLIYINNLADGLFSNTNVFADCIILYNKFI